MTDTFAGTGIKSIIKPLAPKGNGWREVPADQKYSMGYPLRVFFHDESGLAVMSAVETVLSEDLGAEYHISISKQNNGQIDRCDSQEAKWVLRQFNIEGAEEDNHVPYGKVRNFWRPVANNLVGLECKCKASEPEIKENKGDYIWRPDNLGKL